MERNLRQVRSAPTKFETREDGGNLTIEGYFAVFDSNYEIAPGLSESVAPGAFSDTISGDIRALINHDTTLVLGRTKAGTLELREDSHGLWGKIAINPNDGDAMNLYERVKRGDVDQCSFGIDITEEETDFRADGSIHWTIKAVELYEVSCCTFPAYEQTNISARTAERDEIKKRELEAWRMRQKERLSHGTESADAEKENQ
jgi:HK97 family phage prohead protease